MLPTGVVAISGFSSIALVTDNNLAVTGLAATGSTETVLVWQVITPSDNNPWQVITPSNNNPWQVITPSDNNPGYTPINT